MTNILNGPTEFAGDMLSGYSSAYSRYLRLVPGAGVVRRTVDSRATTRLVLGGGSGHFPWTAGFVGAGLADGAALGDVFTSPSAEQIYRVAKILPPAGGVLFCYGNYAGDVLHFDMAQARLRGEGVDCRSVVVTDDVASGAADNAAVRRGIAGSLAVFKVAGAAVARGDGIDDVERIARLANARTRSLGVAFAGCTLPGAAEPLFRVEPGSIAVGLGIHGEPGIRTVPSMPARELAATLVAALLPEAPVGNSGRVTAILNGLGATSHEELYVLWGGIARQLDDAGIEVVLPEVGELATSLDMAGCSLTLSWLDDELEELWAAPADTPSFRRAPAQVQAVDGEQLAVAVPEVGAADGRFAEHGGAAGPEVDLARAVLVAMLAAVSEAEAELGRLDAIAGDGDHGSGMTRGLRAAVEAATSGHSDLSSLLRAAGAAWSDKGGGTSGALWGVLLGGVADGLAADGQGYSASRIVAAVSLGCDRVAEVGHASVGDKTMLDAFVPFVDALRAAVDSGAPLGAAWSGAAQVATEAAAATADLRPRLGRARPLAERSLGSPDPGAVSLALCLNAAGSVLAALPA
ncbi:dihydroxyacetone kinase family protein [Rugosimonospora africana]|nr:dihydroxyacetone kinase family protein [Rugosimonospora africana]